MTIDSDYVFKALAHRSRRKLLDVLCEKNGQTLGELCEHLSTSRQAVMKHLAILENANLVVVAWEGREKLHYLNPAPIQETYGRWVDKFARSKAQALDFIKRDLEEKKGQVT
ncbi:MAG: ArsR/SmtB family transcription factor [Leptospirales bacterium]